MVKSFARSTNWVKLKFTEFDDFIESLIGLGNLVYVWIKGAMHSAKRLHIFPNFDCTLLSFECILKCKNCIVIE